MPGKASSTVILVKTCEIKQTEIFEQTNIWLDSNMSYALTLLVFNMAMCDRDKMEQMFHEYKKVISRWFLAAKLNKTYIWESIHF